MSAVLSKNTAGSIVKARQTNDPLSLKDLETQFEELTAPPSAADIAALKAKLTGAAAPEAPKKLALIGTLEQRYLHHALDRATEPMHPNFIAALKKREGALEEAQLQRTVIARAFDAGRALGRRRPAGHFVGGVSCQPELATKRSMNDAS